MSLANNDAIALLEEAAAELADIHRGKHYALWRDDRRRSLGDALMRVSPFDAYAQTWIFTGDGGGAVAQGRFGDWAIDRLVEKLSAEEILAAFAAEASGNSAVYDEASPVLGVQVDATVILDEGISLDAEPTDSLEAILFYSPFQRFQFATGTSLLKQTYSVTPSFVQGDLGAAADSVTKPEAAVRDRTRGHVRLACLLASAGPVELPISALVPSRHGLFVAGHGNQAGRPQGMVPMVAFPVEGAAVKRAYALLATFKGGDSMARAINRLGRSRLAASPVDRALDLGMAAEIVLMHDHSPANTEIVHKIGSRAAWLLGRDPETRAAIFAEMKALYQARSQAVHSGVLSSKSRIDLDAADRLVTSAFNAILERGRFPDWSSLVMGGDALQQEPEED